MTSSGFDRRLAFDHYVGGMLAWILNSLACLLALVWHRDHSLTKPPRSVLLLKFVGLGSIVRSSFLITGVRTKYPDAQICFATFPGPAPLVRMYKEVDHVQVVRDHSTALLIIDTIKLLAWCWKARVDLVIDLEFHAKYSSVVSALSFAKDRAGFAGITSRFRRGLYTHLVFWNPFRYVGRAYRQLGAAINLPESPEANIQIPEDAREEAVGFLRSIGWNEATKLITINPNASDLRPERRWPTTHFSEVVSLLPTGHPLMVVVCGSKSEWSTAEEVVKEAGQGLYPVHNIAGKISFAALCEILNRSAAFVSNDSGPMHVARTLGVPTVSLWGATHPGNYSPPGGRHIAIYQPIYCSPCTHATDCPPCDGDNQCMKRIRPVRVVRAVCKLMGIPCNIPPREDDVSIADDQVLGYWKRHSVLPPAGQKAQRMK